MKKEKPEEKIRDAQVIGKIEDTGLNPQTVTKEEVAAGLKIVLNFEPTDKGPNLFSKSEKGRRHVKVSYRDRPNEAELIEKLIAKLEPLQVPFSEGTSSIQRKIHGFGDKANHMHMGLLTLEFDIDESQRKQTRALIAEFINDVAKDDPVKWACVSAIQNTSHAMTH